MKAEKGKFFSRGIRLKGHKELTAEKPIERLALPKEVRIPLRQHIGAPATAYVSVGQSVKRGDCIGRSAGKISANVHASVAGTVTAVEEQQDDRGGSCLFIVISSSGAEETDYAAPLVLPDADAIRERIFEAGIVGMGGAGFPAHVKAAPGSPVDTLILNGAECEPYLTCDDRLMRERRDEILRGAEYLKTALGAREIVIGIEKNKPEAIANFEETPYRTVALKKRYPMGSEKHIVYSCTGRKIPPGKLPADVGVSVQNVGTALAVCEAVEQGKPLIERVVTLSGGGIREPKNLLCPVGTPLSDLIAACGGAKDDTVKLVAGGPMTGTALTGESAVVTKMTSGFLLLSEEETNSEPPTPCINCGKCASVCPMKLMPMQIEFYTAAGDFSAADKYGGVLACIECGSCSYICPARRPLSQAIKTAKENLRRKA